MLHKTKSLALAAALSTALVGGFLISNAAASEINVAPGKTLAGPGLAVHGFDPVAYFADGKPAQGSAEFSVVHGDATYRFASARNMKAFRANPDKYVPAFGGYCAYGVAVGAKFDGDPRYWKIVDGKLYLNLNREIQDTWLKNVPGYLDQANGIWKKIRHTDPASLG